MVFEHEGERGSQWSAISSIAANLGMTPETLRKWVRRAETDEGLRPGLTTTERERLKALERENRELRRANEILKAAATFFGAELDRRHESPLNPGRFTPLNPGGSILTFGSRNFAYLFFIKFGKNRVQSDQGHSVRYHFSCM